MVESPSINQIARRLQHDHPDWNAYTAWQEARRRHIQNIQPLPAEWTCKDAVLEALDRAGTNAGMGVDSLVEWLNALGKHASIAELNKILWDLQKAQMVAFKESHTAKGSQLSRVRLTLKGRAKAMARRGETQIEQPKPDKSGKVEVVNKVARRKPEVLPPPPKPKALGDPPRQNQKTTADVIDETGSIRKLAEADVKTSDAYGTPDTHTQYPIDWKLYPEISMLVERNQERKAKRKKAAKLVEAAAMVSDADPETADMLMARATELEGEPLTKLEREVIDLLHHIMPETELGSEAHAPLAGGRDHAV